MKETIYTQTLCRAAEAEGGIAALASVLHVPEKTLERWMSGRAQTPLRAFLKVLERLAAHEASGAVSVPIANGEPLTFSMGQLQARCSRCDSTEFVPAQPGTPLKVTSELVCCACGERVARGDLIARLAQDAVQYSHAMTSARERRRGALSAARSKKPQSSG